MGLIEPSFPDIDLEQWRKGDRAARLTPMARHVASVGFGTPDVVYSLYAVKIALYVCSAIAFCLTTPGIDGFFTTSWWGAYVVFQKLVLWTMLFEVLGLGCGFGPLNLRISPPLGSFLYWLRPGTIRLAPWPNRLPGTGGDSRQVVDVVLYAALLAALVVALWGEITRPQVAGVLVVLALIGLRDKVIFLAARGEVYGTLALTFLLSGTDPIVGSKVVLLLIWWGAGTSKLNRHFPNVIACMLSNSPVIRARRLKLMLHRSYPDDLRPSRVAMAIAHLSTFMELVVSATLFFSDGGLLTTIAAVAMIAFHVNILVSMPQGAPLEWNVFMSFAVWSLFVQQAELGLGDVDNLLPIALLAGTVVAIVAYGNVRPDKVSFLPAMRYYAGNWDTSQWCFTDSGLDKLRQRTKRAAPLPFDALEAFYGKEQMDLPIWIGYAFRAMHTHGRALVTLMPRACAPLDDLEVTIVEGELVAGVTLGWNFGDGHFHNEQLLAALQARCQFEPGELRVIILEAQPIQRQWQRYRLVDAATGEFERGEIAVADMLAAQPWETLPVHVTS